MKENNTFQEFWRYATALSHYILLLECPLSVVALLQESWYLPALSRDVIRHVTRLTSIPTEKAVTDTGFCRHVVVASRSSKFTIPKPILLSLLSSEFSM